MLEDIASNPNVKNWVSMVKNPLSNLGFLSSLGISRSWKCKKKNLTISKQRLLGIFWVPNLIR